MEMNDTSVEVLYDFEYSTKEGLKVTIKEGEKLYLIKKTNNDWWQVIRNTGKRPFYVPSTYVKELPSSKSRRSKHTTSSNGENDLNIDNSSKFTVSLNIKPRPVDSLGDKRVLKSSSLTKIMLNCDSNDVIKEQVGRDSVNSNESLSGESSDKSDNEKSDVDANRYGLVSSNDRGSNTSSGYSVVQLSKRGSTSSTIKNENVGEANILEETLSESLVELANQIKFRTKAMEGTMSEKKQSGFYVSASRHGGDRLKYAGSFKTSYERKKLFRQFSESCPDVAENFKPNQILDESDSRFKSLSNLLDDSSCAPIKENLADTLERKMLKYATQITDIENIQNNNWKQCDINDETSLKDSVDSLDSSGKLSVGGKTNSSCESMVESKGKSRPEPKPRRFVPPKPKQEEVIYANFLELTKDKERLSVEENEDKVVQDSLTKEDTGNINEEKKSTGVQLKRTKAKYSKPPSIPRLNSVPKIDLPSGWTTGLDSDLQLPCYLHSDSGEKWFSSSDDQGRVYYFQANSAESSWTLPDKSINGAAAVSLPTAPHGLRQPFPLQHSSTVGDMPQITEELSAILSKISKSSVDPAAKRPRNVKALSMIVPNKDEINSGMPQLRPWPQLTEGKNMFVVCEAPLHYTKICDGGKRVKKNWNSAYVVLTELFLLIYKDMKACHSQKTPPELTVDLNGAQVYSGEKVSGRKHVLVISTVLGLQIALQCENTNSALFWATKIQHMIVNLPKSGEAMQKLASIVEGADEARRGASIGRSKSVNFKSKDDSMEDLGSTPAERQMNIKGILKKFFHRRPTMESLVKKGIWKDEPVFACFLEQACGNNNPRVPMFVQKCVAVIESNVENMKTDGLYRASGNLSQIQKIRLQIDQNNYAVLEQEEDVHVLTGALKLFFRELKEPLIPFKLLPKAIAAASNTSDRKQRLKMFTEIIKSLPVANRDTLKFLLQHLLRVSQYQEHNRMHISNVAIVFGPTLMWREKESLDIATDMMQQNMVIEHLLIDFHNIFK